MNINEMITIIKNHPDFPKAGMVLCHNGVVRESSRDGKAVTGLSVEVDQAKLEAIVAKYKKTEGIVEILVEIASDKPLSVGDDVMVLVVAGDIRETVIQTLADALNEIKSTVTKKTEFFK